MVVVIVTLRDVATHFLWSLCAHLAGAMVVLVAVFVAQDQRWAPTSDTPTVHTPPVPAPTVPVPTPEAPHV